MRQQIAQLGEALLLTVIDVVHFYFILLNILVYILSGNRMCLCLPIPLPLSTKYKITSVVWSIRLYFN